LAAWAKAAGVPVYYFVPPQIWAWRTGRVKKVRRGFDAVLTALPFEDEWYRVRGGNTHYTGHPYFDELAAHKFDPAFPSAQRGQPGRGGAGPVVAILPGSRDQEVRGNLSLILATARKVRTARPDVRFLVAAFNDRQAELVRATAANVGVPLEVH